MLKEFKEFAVKGNVVDMAIGIIIGGAFAPIAKSIVDDILMPPIGMLFGGVDFANLFAILKEGAEAGPYATLEAAKEAGAVTVNYGILINSLITFLIVAFAAFMIVKWINRLKREEEAPAAEPTTKPCPQCCSEIAIEASRCPNCTSELPATG